MIFCKIIENLLIGGAVIMARRNSRTPKFWPLPWCNRSSGSKVCEKPSLWLQKISGRSFPLCAVTNNLFADCIIWRRWRSRYLNKPLLFTGAKSIWWTPNRYLFVRRFVIAASDCSEKNPEPISVKPRKAGSSAICLHVLATTEKKICQVVLTPGNYADRTVAEALTEFFEFQTVIGDLAYRGAKLQTELFEQNHCLLITKQDAKKRKQRLPPVRQRIEAGFSILWHHFIDRVFSRSWIGLWNTILLKLLFFNLFR